MALSRHLLLAQEAYQSHKSFGDGRLTVFHLRAAFSEMLARSLHSIASCAPPFIAENFQEVHFPSDGIVQQIRAGYLNVQPLFAIFSCGKMPGFPQMAPRCRF